MDLNQIPDDILLRVFAELDMKQLITHVRAVCKRWRDLALHRDVWRHRTICTSDLVDYGEHRLLYELMKVAPCVRELRINAVVFEDYHEELDLKGVIETTDCAAERLDMALFTDDHFAVNAACNQAAKGRLRSLLITVWGEECLDVILDAIKDLQLNELCFRQDDSDYTPLLAPSDVDGWGSGALRHLHYYGEYTDPLLSFLLRARFRSLEVVRLGTRHALKHSAPSLALLGRCRNLRKAYVGCAVPELISFRDCPNLMSLKIHIIIQEEETFRRPELSSTLVQYFGSASAARITVLGLSCSSENGMCCSVLLECLIALAKHRRSALQDMCLLFCGPFDNDRLDQLGQVLPGLPQLRRLKINQTLSAGLLGSICPRNAPSLLTLVLYGNISLSGKDMLELTELLRRNPRLQVQMEVTEDSYYHYWRQPDHVYTIQSLAHSSVSQASGSADAKDIVVSVRF